MVTSRLFAEHNRESIKEIAANGGLAIIPIGAIEQHGPHLPVWTDTLNVETITRAASVLVDNSIPILVTPTLPFGSSDPSYDVQQSLPAQLYSYLIYFLSASFH